MAHPPFKLKEGGFKIVDYCLFVILCLLSSAGGLWYSIQGAKKSKVADIKDYLLGNRELSIVPVTLSLIATYLSGVTILGTPTEVFNYGIQLWLIIVAVIICCAIIILVYLPVFYTLHLSSSYEYLELRFNRQVRAAGSILFMIDEILFLPIVIYVPSLALRQLTRINEFIVAVVMVVITGLYTVLGGLRAVVWTDMVQIGLTYIGVIMVAIAGTCAAGGWNTLITAAKENNRLSVNNWSFSMYERQTGWGVILGGSIYWTCFNSVNQCMVQRYLSVATLKRAHQCIYAFCAGIIVCVSSCIWAGLAAWAVWSTTGCHPSAAPIVADKLVPSFVIYIAEVQKLPGMPGVFVAGVFGASLSSLSAVLNACALVAVEDILRGWLRVQWSPTKLGYFARIFTAVLCIISVVLILVVAKLGGILGVATALSAIAASTTCGIFTLGMCCYWVGPKGAMAGGIAGFIMSSTVAFGTQVVAGKGLRAPPAAYNAACAKNASKINVSINPNTVSPLFKISYNWVAPIGFVTTMIVGALFGLFLDKKEDRKMDSELFTPCVWRFLPAEAKEQAGMYRLRYAARLGEKITLPTRTSDTPAWSLFKGKEATKEVRSEKKKRLRVVIK
ncbi:sodium:solute symporter family domain-containing protein [Phthorimaea operculella]|nr:sodium:solute symporter family domain-containing protein [Phthorimaea operculella]